MVIKAYNILEDNKLARDYSANGKKGLASIENLDWDSICRAALDIRRILPSKSASPDSANSSTSSSSNHSGTSNDSSSFQNDSAWEHYDREKNRGSFRVSIDKVIDHKNKKGQYYFLVKWAGYKIRPMWEIARTVEGHPEALRAYLQSLQRERPRSLRILVDRMPDYLKLLDY